MHEESQPQMIQPPSVWMLFTGNRKSLLQVTISALCETVVLGGWLSSHIVAIRTLQRGCAALPCSGVQFGTCPSVTFQRYPIRGYFFLKENISSARQRCLVSFAADQHRWERTHVKQALGNRIRSNFICAALIVLWSGLVLTGCNSGSGSPAPPISVSISPVRGGATATQSVNFIARVQNDVGSAGV